MFICICTQLKNDSDIVESFCRYHLLFVDHIILTDDRSDDNTVDIIKAMIAEGLPITLMQVPLKRPILQGPDFSTNQKMHHYAFNHFGADIIVPLDVDEFLFCADGRNPREELEAFEPDVEYHVFWRTSVYKHDPEDGTVFLPSYFDEFRDPALEIYVKTFLTRQLSTEREATFTRGRHALYVPDRRCRQAVSIVRHSQLFIAHFPLRSTTNTIIKIANGWHKFLYYMKPGSSWDENGFQWKDIYDFMAQHGSLTATQVRNLSKTYAIPKPVPASIKLIKQPYGALVSNFLQEPPKLRYTSYKNINSTKLVLSFYELLLKNLMNMTR